MRHFLFLLLLLTRLPLFAQDIAPSALPKGFGDLEKAIPGIVVDIRYTTNNNFLGRPVDGYHAPKAILSTKAIEAVQKIQAELNKEGLGLKVFDAYRPQRAVNHFVRWAKDINDTIAKSAFYPDVDKRNLFKDGFIASRSGHSRGSTIDLTIIDLKTGEELDMGTPFDFFGEQSHHDFAKLSETKKQNRKKLRNIMEKHGFKAYAKEWWHYTLKDEPFPVTYFDFVIE